MATQIFSRCLIGVTLGAVMLAQGVKPPPGGGGGGAGKPSIPTQPNAGPGNTQQPDFSQRPLFLSGKVSMEDGTAPADSATIQLVCRSSPKTIGRTDPKGGFSIDLNNRATIMTFADASESPTLSNGGAGPVTASVTDGVSNTITANTPNKGTPTVNERDLMGCDLQAALPGFRSDVLHLSSRRSMDDPNVGILILHRLGNVEGTTISATSAMAPKNAKKAMERGQNAAKKENFLDALDEFHKAVEIYPKYAMAWVELGRVQESLKNPEAARHSFARALEADGKLVTPYIALASLAAREGKWQEVADDSDRALRLNPVDFPEAYLLNAMGNFNLKKMDAAEKSAREGLDRDAEHHYPKMSEVLGAVLVHRKDYAGAAGQLRNYLRYAKDDPDIAMATTRLQQLEKVLSTKAQK